MKICPACQESNHDAAEFCIMCGAELPTFPAQAEQLQRTAGDILMPTGPTSLPEGTLALAVFHDTEKRVLAYFPIETDITLIGREDAAKGVFPDVDLGRLDPDCVTAECVSREHIRLVRRPAGLNIEVIEGSTGTQLNQRLIPAGESSTISVGDRLILGGKVRTKLVRF